MKKNKTRRKSHPNNFVSFICNLHTAKENIYMHTCIYFRFRFHRCVQQNLKLKLENRRTAKLRTHASTILNVNDDRWVRSQHQKAKAVQMFTRNVYETITNIFVIWWQRCVSCTSRLPHDKQKYSFIPYIYIYIWMRWCLNWKHHIAHDIAYIHISNIFAIYQIITVSALSQKHEQLSEIGRDKIQRHRTASNSQQQKRFPFKLLLYNTLNFDVLGRCARANVWPATKWCGAMVRSCLADINLY